MNELFVLNFIGYLVLVAAFWLAPRWLGAKRWLVDAALIVYAALGILAWDIAGRPNPMELGILDKGLEVALIVAVVVHLGRLLARPTVD